MADGLSQAGVAADLMELERQSRMGTLSAAEQIKRQIQAEDKQIQQQIQQMRTLEKYEGMLARELESLPPPEPAKTFDPGLRERQISNNGQINPQQMDVAAMGGPQPAADPNAGLPAPPPDFLVSRSIQEQGPQVTPLAGGAMWLPMRQPTKTTTTIEPNALTKAQYEQIRMARDERRFDQLGSLVNNGTHPVAAAEIISQLEQGNLAAAGKVMDLQPNLARDKEKVIIQSYKEQIRRDRAAIDNMRQDQRLKVISMYGEMLANGTKSGFGSPLAAMSNPLKDFKISSDAFDKTLDNMAAMRDKDGNIIDPEAFNMLNQQLAVNYGFFYPTKGTKGGWLRARSTDVKQTQGVLVEDIVSAVDVLQGGKREEQAAAAKFLKEVGMNFTRIPKQGAYNDEYQQQGLDPKHPDYMVLVAVQQKIQNLRMVQGAMAEIRGEAPALSTLTPPADPRFTPQPIGPSSAIGPAGATGPSGKPSKKSLVNVQALENAARAATGPIGPK